MTTESNGHSELTQNAQKHFETALGEYSEKLLNEAKAIEQLEHTGQGPPEITAAHVEEAKWVLIRRMRRTVRNRGWLITIRIGEYIAAILAGIGGSNLNQTWGVIMTVAAVTVGCGSFVAERELVGGQ